MGKKKERATPCIPDGATAADIAQQVPNNSYSPAPAYYADVRYKCVDCVREEIWTASQQKWYYEIAKGSLYSSTWLTSLWTTSTMSFSISPFHRSAGRPYSNRFGPPS